MIRAAGRDNRRGSRGWGGASGGKKGKEEERGEERREELHGDDVTDQVEQGDWEDVCDSEKQFGKRWL